MTDRTVGVSEEVYDGIAKKYVIWCEYSGDTVVHRRLKSSYDNNIQHKKKQIAKRRAKNKNKKR